MALNATIYTFDMDLANSDRGVYERLDLRAARHPSESETHFLARVMVYCLEFREGIAFSNGLFEPDEPSISIRDLTGVLDTWIDVGAPEPARLHRAAKAARRVAVYVHKDPMPWLARLAGERIHRAERLELYALDTEWLGWLAARLARRMSLSLTIAEQHVYLTLGEETMASVVTRLAVPDVR